MDRVFEYAWPFNAKVKNQMISKEPSTQDVISDLWKHIKDGPSVLLEAGDCDLPKESVLAYADAATSLIWIFCKQQSPIYQATRTKSKPAQLSVVSNDQWFRALLKGTLRQRTEPIDAQPFWNQALAGWYLNNHDDPELPVMCFKPLFATITAGRENYMNFGWDLFGAKSVKRHQDSGYHMEINF